MAVFVVSCVAPKEAKAATATGTQVVQFTILAAAQLTLTGTDPYSFGNVDPIGSPYAGTGAQTATVKANPPSWRLTVKGSGAFSDGTNTVPLARLAAAGSCTSGCTGVTGASVATMTTTDQNLATSTSNTANTVINVDYTLTINWTDPVSVTPPYSATMTYTLTAPNV